MLRMEVPKAGAKWEVLAAQAGANGKMDDLPSQIRPGYNRLRSRRVTGAAK